jgi:outer membrane protein assembly factor BamA
LIRFFLFFLIIGFLQGPRIYANPIGEKIPKDSLRQITISTIEINGLKRTEPFIILNELTFNEGDKIPFNDLLPEIKLNRIYLEKTSLFKSVTIKVANWKNDSIDVVIEVVERWYYIPYPYLDIADRNFNEWITTYNGDFSRLIYGLTFYVNNIRGRNEQLKIRALFGFNQEYGIRYIMPQISKSSKLGFKIEARILKSRNLAYNTISDQLAFATLSDFAYKNYFGLAALRIRSDHNVYHWFELKYDRSIISDTILDLNKRYFNNGGQTQTYFSLGYKIILDKADHVAYPLKGYKIRFEIEKTGLGIYKNVDLFKVKTSMGFYYQLGKNLYGGNRLSWMMQLGKNQPYNLQKALGYQLDLVRGFELKVIDGQQFILLQNDLKFKFLSFSINKPLIAAQQFTEIPFSFFLRPHFDFGYVVDRYFTDLNTLRNKWVFGGGLGLDVVTYYDYAVSLNFSINNYGEKGVYLHVNF